VDPEYARHYYEIATTDHWWYRGRSVLVSELLSRQGFRAGTALDIGAGSSTLIPSSFSTIRLDVVRPHPSGDGSFVQASALRLPFRESEFSVVGLFDLIEHVEDEASLLRQARRVLKPGGAVVATVPAHQWLWSQHDVLSAHIRRYSQKELLAIFRMAGFQVIHCRPFYGFLVLPAVARKILGRGGSMISLAPGVNRMLSSVACMSVKRSLQRQRWGLSMGLLATKYGEHVFE
jgi:SAM-dependent methyltransferase